MGQIAGLPVGLSLVGEQWSDADILALGYAFEQLTHARRAPTFIPSLEIQNSDAFGPAH
jgi:amidase